MTPQADTSLHDDLTFMRALAEAGRNAPLTSGPYFLTAGLVFGLASFVAWAVATGHTLLPPQAQVWVWLAAMVVYLPVIWFLNRAQLGRPGSVVMVNRAIGMMWSGLGSGIGIMFLAGMVLAVRYACRLGDVSLADPGGVRRGVERHRRHRGPVLAAGRGGGGLRRRAGRGRDDRQSGPPAALRAADPAAGGAAGLGPAAPGRPGGVTDHG